MPVQSPKDFVDEFKRRQDCPYIEVNHQLIFENGARIQIRDPRTGDAVATGEVEPPFLHEEDDLRRRLGYWTAFYKREFDRFEQAQTDLDAACGMFLSGATVPAPNPEALTSLQGGKDRLELAAGQIAIIQAEILALPRIVELERQKALDAASRQAMKEAVTVLRGKVHELKVPTPKSLHHVGIDQ